MEIAQRQSGGRSIRITALVVLAFLVVVVAVLATRKSSDSLSAPSTLIGKTAPNINAKTINGDTVSLASYRGKVAVVNFFASWCVPCQQEHNDLKAFAAAHPNDAALLRGAGPRSRL